MKRALLSVVPLLVLAGCATPTDPAPTAPETVDPSPAYVEPPASQDVIVTEAMRMTLAEEGIVLPDGMYLEYARVACDGIGEGLDPLVVARIASAELPQWDVVEHAMIVGASVGALCPEFGGRAGVSS